MIPAEGGGKERENRGNSLRMELSKRSPALPWPRMAPVHANERILLALSASKPTSNHVLSWALQNVVQNVDETVLLLLLIPPQGRPETEVKRPWGFPVFVRDCGRGAQQIMEEDERLIMKRLRNLCDGLKVKAGIKIILRTESANDAIAKEAKKLGATWVILDRNLKKGVGKYCLEHLQCNVALVNHSKAKILHLNLKGSTLPLHAPQSTAELLMKKSTESESESRSSSSESGTPFTKTEHGTSSTAYNSSDPGMSPELPKASTNFVAANKHICYGPISATPDSGIRECHAEVKGSLHMDSDSDVGSVEAIFDNEETTDFASPALHPLPNRSDKVCRSSVKHGLTPEDTECSARDLSKISSKYKPLSVIANPFSMSSQDTQWDPDFPLYTDVHGWTRMPKGCSGKNAGANQHGRKLRSMENLVEGTTMTTMTEKGHLLKLEEWEEGSVNRNCKGTMLKPELLERASSLRKSISLVSKKMPPVPPPLCSLCQHKAPVFGKPPRRFCYTELEVATGGFSEPNFLAEGSFGSVHRGVLSDGQAIAVKQHKLASSQGDVEFCAEVEVLSCAQHRNVVMLIGYCVEEKRRLLVYEFICNGSLDSHLSGKRRPPLEWSSRQKIALGAARGLRYLHEECRVGCIVHRDVRPNNILLTHDFEPMVGDFGLARWQPDGDLGVETRVIGTFGYLAPEYAQSGEVTEKADVYSFGVVLLELVSGRKAIDINRPKGQQCLTEWAWRLLNQDAIQELIDPSLEGWYSDYEVYCMLHAAMLCICKDSHLRPRMSQVLRILEGDIILDRSGAFSPFFASSNTLNNPDQYRNGYARSFIEYDQSRSSQSINHNASLASEYLLMEKLSILCHSHSNWQ